MRVLYFGTYDRDYPRNAQVIAALRRSGVEVVEQHSAVWEGSRHNWRAGMSAGARLARGEARLWRRPPEPFDALIVGYPGHLDLPWARRAARGRPVVFNPLVSLYDTFVGDRRRFRPGSPAARALRRIDVAAFRAASVVVADTDAQAAFFAELAQLPAERVETCFVGAEERLFRPGWAPVAPFRALFVGKLIPLHGIETVLDAARLAPEIAFRVVGSGQLEERLASRPPNVEHVSWVAYDELPRELRAAGCALGIFGSSAKAGRVIPNKVFQALACGTPVITAGTPASRELLVDGRSALLVPPADPAALAAAVRRLAGDPALARRIGDEGCSVFRAKASEDVLGRRWRDVLERSAA